MSFSNSTPHFGHVVASSGMKAPHSPHSTILPSPKTFQYTVTPTAAATAAPRITKRSQYGRPRIGTGWERNGRVFFTVIDSVTGWMTPEDGVTIKLYGPSAAFPGTLIVPKKNPWSWDEVVFEAIVTAPERSSIVRSTFGIPVEPAWSRTYPLTLSPLPGSTVRSEERRVGKEWRSRGSP